MMKITKKTVIKKMLMNELNSEEMQKRIAACGNEFKIKWDMLIDDDERIKYIDELRKDCHTTINNYKGRCSTMLLTNRAYLLLAAYKGSYSKLLDKKCCYENKIVELMIKPAWYSELACECKFLRNEIDGELLRNGYSKDELGY